MENTNEMTFLEHLEDLRWTLVRSVIAISVFAIAAFIFKDVVFDEIVLAPREPEFLTYKGLCNIARRWSWLSGLCMEAPRFQIQNISMSGQFVTHLMVSFVVGIIVAFPYVLWEFWRFIRPGMRQQEQQSVRWVVFSGSLLFFTGVMFGYWLLAPLSVQFLGGYQVSAQVANIISLNSYISTVTSVTLASGVLFQLPLVVLFLVKAGLVTPEMLKRYRKHAFVAVLVLSAVITPPDVSSQIIITLPLMLLYEASIVLARRTVKRMQATGTSTRPSPAR